MPISIPINNAKLLGVGKAGATGRGCSPELESWGSLMLEKPNINIIYRRAAKGIGSLAVSANVGSSVCYNLMVDHGLVGCSDDFVPCLSGYH